MLERMVLIAAVPALVLAVLLGAYAARSGGGADAETVMGE